MKRHTKIMLAVGALALLGVATVATTSHAHRSWHGEYGYGHGGYGEHRGGGHGAAMLRRFDADGDGKVTRAEVDRMRQDKLRQFDSDGDGSLSLGEFEGLWLDFVRERMVDRFQDLDGDGDGKVTQSEIDRRMSRMFERMDRNEDGVLDRGDRRRHGYGHHWESEEEENARE